MILHDSTCCYVSISVLAFTLHDSIWHVATTQGVGEARAPKRPLSLSHSLSEMAYNLESGKHRAQQPVQHTRDVSSPRSRDTSREWGVFTPSWVTLRHLNWPFLLSWKVGLINLPSWKYFNKNKLSIGTMFLCLIIFYLFNQIVH